MKFESYLYDSLNPNVPVRETQQSAFSGQRPYRHFQVDLEDSPGAQQKHCRSLCFAHSELNIKICPQQNIHSYTYFWQRFISSYPLCLRQHLSKQAIEAKHSTTGDSVSVHQSGPYAEKGLT